MISILLGLAGLGIVILFHELGHLAAAKATGIEVETFSIGWGPRIAGFRWAGTDWQLSAFPIGGYCKMRGEDAFRRAAAEHLEWLPAEPGSFYGASPLKRMAVAIAGPTANIIFATIVFALVAAIGYTIQTTPAKIILASEIETGASLEVAPLPNPADSAGLRSGDTILALGGKIIRDYADIQDVVGINPDTPLALKYQRDGEVFETTITPRLDRSSGAGKIGVYSWVSPTIATVAEGSAAAVAGLQSGDTIISALGKPIRHSMDLYTILSLKPEKMDLVLDRGGEQVATTAILGWDEETGQGLGVSFMTTEREVKVPGFFPAIGAGFQEMKSTVAMTVKGLGLLFRGVEIFSALSGPARITWMVGKATTESVRESGAAGLVQVFNFLAFLSVGLFIMNLLPIPALDGGLLIIFVVEMFRRRPLKAKTIMRLQLIGTVFIFSIFILATLGDILFFTKL